MTPTVGPAPSSLPSPHLLTLMWPTSSHLRSRLLMPEFVCSPFLPFFFSSLSFFPFFSVPSFSYSSLHGVALVYIFNLSWLHLSLSMWRSPRFSLPVRSLPPQVFVSLLVMVLMKLLSVCHRPSFCHSNPVFLWLDMPLIILLCVPPVNLCPLAKLILSIITVFILCSLCLFEITMKMDRRLNEVGWR